MEKRLYNGKWDGIWDRPKYQNIRKKIKEAFKDLQFEEGPHKYYIDGKEITCVSNVTHMYQEHFDTDAVAQKTFERNYNNPDSKYYQMTPDEIKKEWKKISTTACDFGTTRHLYAESIFYFMTHQYNDMPEEYKGRIKKDENGRDYFEILYPEEEAAAKYYEDMPKCIVPILAETKVYDKDREYSGTFDLLTYYDAELDGKNNKNSGLIVNDWKGLDITTPILTTDGWKTMETIQVGDTVFDKDGNPTKVLHTSEIHHRDCYKITFDTNESVICDDEHRWLISYRNSGSKNGFTSQITDAKKMYSGFSRNLIKRRSEIIPKILNQKPICYKEVKDVEIDPYVLGVWLGDGHSACGMITNMYDEIFNEIRRRGFEIGDDVSHGEKSKAKSCTILGLLPLLKKYKLIKNKHIPYQYLLSDYEIKFQILQGLMDTGGYYNPKRGRYVLSTTRINQVNFSLELLASLSIKATIIKCFKYCNGKKIEGFDVCFWSDRYPFLQRKIEIIKTPKTDKRSFRNIRNIEKVDSVPTRCIEVDSDTHTFLCGKGLIPTHNTNKDLYKNFNNKKLLPPFDELLDMPLSIYKLQLSLYQNPLENLGFKVVARRIMWLRPSGEYEKIKLESYVDKLRKDLDERVKRDGRLIID